MDNNKDDKGEPKRLTSKEADELIEFLNSLPPKPDTERPISKREFVTRATPVIHALRERGYTLVEIREMLSGRGFETTASSLKSLLARARVQEPSRPRRRKRPKAKQGDSATNVPSEEGVGKAPPKPRETAKRTGNSALQSSRITGGESDEVD